MEIRKMPTLQRKTLTADLFCEVAGISTTTLSNYNKIIRLANGIKTPKRGKYIGDL